MANAAILDVREIVSKKMDTLRAAVKLSEDRAKAAAAAKEQEARLMVSTKS